MASGQGGRLEVGASGSSALAKPLYLQRLERTLRLDGFLRQTAAIFNGDITRYRSSGYGVHLHFFFAFILRFVPENILGSVSVGVIVIVWQTSTYFSCSSDDSDDSDAALGTGLSLDPSTQHTALTVKSEQGDGLAEAKPFNGVLLQGKGKIHSETVIFLLFTYYYTCTSSLVSFNCSWKIKVIFLLFLSTPQTKNQIKLASTISPS